ncbi:MAG TPA: pilus assembly protein TadG-related protein [Rhizomicrobium sp.]|nr:pilus assembly protein TadG-related protein [Rhizomicrobium sp.]
MIRNRQANVAMTFAFALIPVMFAVGAGIDYTSAAVRESQLDAYADAAALAGVRPAVLSQNDAASVAAATAAFNAQAGAYSSVNYNPANLTVTVLDTGARRTVKVAWSASSPNAFAGILGFPTTSLSGSSQAVGAMAPNINFYLLLDSSPSQAIAATPAGIATMVANTPAQGGCAFGCHESNPGNDNLGNPNGEDNYTLARNLGVALRIDNVKTAAQDLMSTAQTTEQTNQATYGMAIDTFDVSVTSIQSLTTNLTQAAQSAGNISMLEVYDQNCLTQLICNADEDTNYDLAMQTINTAMPDPGNGTNSQGDTPQEVLFLVTDGVEDEFQAFPLNPTSLDPGRQQYLMNSNTDWCSAIKNRGIRIAVLYTEYLPLPTNAWYENFDNSGLGISSFQSQIATQLQTCASPGLYYEVETGGDITAALNSLFQIAVQTSYLSK